MKLSRAQSFRRRLLAPLLCSCLAGMAILPAAHAARARHEIGLRLLQAQIPVGASLRRQDCDHLARAVHAATLAHRPDAVRILLAALSLDEWDARRKVEDRLSCVCVVRIFHAAAMAAPDRSVVLLEAAEALYPDCSLALTASLRDLESRITVAATSNSANGGDGDDQGRVRGPADGVGTGDGISGDGFGSGAGLGAGFPGSPGFGGSAPSGGAVLPAPVPAPVTSVVNN